LFRAWKNIDDRFDSRLDKAMKRDVLFLFACMALLSFASVGTAAAADSKLEKAVRDADAEWSKFAAAKDLEKTVAFYADDAVVCRRINRQ
jgi:hypothetical protein